MASTEPLVVESPAFGALLDAARQQPLPQRILFVFMKTVAQKDYTAEQRADVAAGRGGALLPAFCVDLTPDEVASFANLVGEADQQAAWDKVLVACIDDPYPRANAKSVVDDALKLMLARVQTGESLTDFLCFSRQGETIEFQ